MNTPASNEPVVVVRDVFKEFRKGETVIPVLAGMDLELLPGDYLAMMGPSGSGKSTLLHLVAALDTPDSGSIELHTANTILPVHSLSESEADNYRRQHIGIVFQKFNLIDCISVAENILLPSKLNKLPLKGKEGLSNISDILGIAELLQKLPTELSGGEQQRVAIARALLHKPALILADEPTGNLDEANSDLVSQLLFETCQEYGASLLVVTHSEKLANMADVRLLMHNKRLQSADA